MKRLLRTLALAAAFVAPAAANAQTAYMIANFPQWAVDEQRDENFATVFGAGGSIVTYAGADWSTLSTADFLWFEGGAEGDTDMKAFIEGNMTSIEAWVAAGGRLVFNSAGWNTGMSYGFGGVTLTFTPDYGAAIFDVAAVNPTHAIFTGPYGTTTGFDGNYFAHGYISGTGLTDLIDGETGSHGVQTALAEMDFGLGHVMFGGMTDSYWWSPQPEGRNLDLNVMCYAAFGENNTECENVPPPVNAVPEPGTVILLGTGLLGLVGGVVRRRRNAVAV